jgi:hypothetical protein
MKLLLVTFGIVVTLALGVFFAVGRPIKWIFPADDAGWVAVQFDNPSCPPLHTDWIFLVVDVPDQKSTCTSTRLPRGVEYFRFQARKGTATRPLKWGDSAWPARYQKDSGWYLIFVGTKEKFNHSGPMPRPWIH